LLRPARKALFFLQIYLPSETGENWPQFFLLKEGEMIHAVKAEIVASSWDKKAKIGVDLT